MARRSAGSMVDLRASSSMTPRTLQAAARRSDHGPQKTVAVDLNVTSRLYGAAEPPGAGRVVGTARCGCSRVGRRTDFGDPPMSDDSLNPVSYTHLRAHET